MHFDELKGKKISLIIWNTEIENDVRVFAGALKTENGKNYFVNEEKGWKLSFEEEYLERVRPVSDDLKEMLLHADYVLSLSMGNLPETGAEGYNDTGINWTE